MFVAGVLVLASAATPEVRTAGLDAVRRGLNDTLNGRSREAGLLLGERGLNPFAIQHEWDEYSFAAFVVVGGTLGRQARETVAAIDELFNC